MYREVWEASFGESLTCEREPDNATDRHAVAVRKEGIIVGIVTNRSKHR